MSKWENKKTTKSKCGPLIDNYIKWRESRGLGDIILPQSRYILIHTLAHALINELSLESGYSSASIRERIYSTENTCGLLLYTAAGDSDGSLGGLVQQGTSEIFEQLLGNALDRSIWCTSDPLCFENEPKHTGTLNGSACHACMFLSETSCEATNRLLDRSLIRPISESKESFFNLF